MTQKELYQQTQSTVPVSLEKTIRKKRSVKRWCEATEVAPDLRRRQRGASYTMADVDDSGVVQGARVQIDGLKARPELNGSMGTVTGFNEENGRCNVRVDDGEVLALKLGALTIAAGFEGLTIGTRVRIGGLTSREELNGKLATVEGFTGERVNVVMDEGGSQAAHVALKPAVLAIAEVQSPARSASAGDGDDGSMQVRVECDGVMLKLTLTAKQLKKPFKDGVLKPFLKAYSKKKGIEPAVDVSRVSQVTVDSDGQRALKSLTDIHIFPSEEVFKGLRGDIDVDIFLKTDEQLRKEEEQRKAAEELAKAAKEAKNKPPEPPPPPPPPPPQAAPKAERLPTGGRVEISGLTSDEGKNWNGWYGRIKGYNEEKGRYDVEIGGEDLDKVMSLHRKNLIHVDANGHHILARPKVGEPEMVDL
jgi:hypothetical protein